MQLTPYTFYIAKCDQTAFKLKHAFNKIDATTGELISGTVQDFTTDMLSLSRKEGLLFRCNVEASSHLVAFYRTSNDSSFISAVRLKDYANTRIDIPANANYYMVYIDGRDSYAQSIAAINGPSFLYYTYQVTPIYKTLVKRYEREKDYIFFREKLVGNMAFKGEDYELLKNAKLTDKFMLLIYTGEKEQVAYSSFDNSFSTDFARTPSVKDTRAVYYKGSFGVADCVINYSTLTATLQKTSPEDQYNTILEGLDKTYDLIKLAPRITPITIYKRPIVQVYIGGANTITNLIGGTYWEQDVTEPILDENALDQTYHFAKVKTYYELSLSGPLIQPGNFSTLTFSSDPTFTVPEIPSLGGTLQVGYTLWQYRANQNEIWRLWVSYIEGYLGFKATLGIYNQAGEPLIESEESEFNMQAKTYSLHNFLVYWKESKYPQFYLLDGSYAGQAVSLEQKIYRRVLLDKSITAITDSEGTKETYDITSDDFAISNINYRRAIGLEGGNYRISGETTMTPTRYGINDKGEYFTSQFVPGASGLGYERLVPISRSGWGNASIWIEYSSLYKRPDNVDISSLDDYCAKYTLKDAYHIIDILKVLLKEIDPSLQDTIISNFFAYKTASSNPITYNAFEVFLTPKSNALKGNYDQPAQKAEVTLGQMLTMLATCFNCYWDIAGSKLRLEHKSFFDKGNTYSDNTNVLALDKLYDQFNGQELLYGQSEKQFDISKLYSRLEMTWPDNSTELFGPLHIDANSSYAKSAEVKTLTPDGIASDIDYMLASPNDFSQDGFALLCAKRLSDGSYELPIIARSYVTEEGDDYAAKIQNYYASWPYLALFHQWEGPTPSLLVSIPRKETIQPSRLIPVERQSIVFPYTKSLNMLQSIQTELGTGRLVKGETDIDIKQCKIELELLRNE